jgi:LPS-assembly protein
LGYTGPAPTSSLITTNTFSKSTSQLNNLSPAPSFVAYSPPPLGYVGPVPRNMGSASATPPNSPSKLSVDETHTGETLITAQKMHTDSTTNITTASGKVEIVRNNYILHADKVTYDQKTGVMTADGHVAILDPTGEVEFSTHEEITGDMKQAFAENAGVLFPDNSRMSSVNAQHYDERYTIANKGAYTACNVCLTNPDQPPLWQLHADTITHDNVEHEIFYHDATIDMLGVPIAYTPYMSGPDPTVKRLQGFLSPSPGYSPNIGAYVRTPYYLDIAPNIDATVTPTFSETDKLQVATQYRERFAQGALSFDGSLTYADLTDTEGVNKGDRWRGDLFGTSLFDLDSTWRAGTNIQYASDQSYLQRYNISSLDQTVARAYVEGFQGEDYAALNSYYLKDLRPGVDVSEPLVLPSANVDILGAPGQTLGGRWSFDGNTLITQRDNTNQSLAQQGPDTRRLSTNTGWQRQFISDTGLETTVSGLFRTDSYWANNVVSSDDTSVYSQALYTRQFEQANAVMRYPMGRSGDGYQQLLEPIVAFTAAPNVRTIAEQPNEDSLDVEFDETNLFSPNRFTGSDLIEGGNRVTYGMRNAITADSGARIDIFGGQSYDFTENSDFPDLSGLNTHASDYVGRIDLAPSDWLNANYGFRFAETDLSPQRQDALVSIGQPVFRPFARYLEVYEAGLVTNPDGTTSDITQLVKQLTVGFNSTLTKYWSLGGFHTQGFSPEPGPRNTGLTLNYVDECLAFGITASNDETNRQDISSGTSVSFHLYLRNLGGFHTDSVSNITYPTQFRQTDESSQPGW